jgi:hypothetical protein
MFRRIGLGLMLLSLVMSTGCFWRCHRSSCGRYTRATPNYQGGMMSGCNECSNYGSAEMFGNPTYGSAMMQQPPVDERLNLPAKQNAYEGPAKK